MWFMFSLVDQLVPLYLDLVIDLRLLFLHLTKSTWS